MGKDFREGRKEGVGVHDQLAKRLSGRNLPHCFLGSPRWEEGFRWGSLKYQIFKFCIIKGSYTLYIKKFKFVFLF